jgi:hypothetical protein
MNINFINYNGIKGYARVMYNDVKDADKYRIDVAYNGRDVKDLLEYLFKLESKIDNVIELIDKENLITYFRETKDFELANEFEDLYKDLKEDK